MFEGLSSRAGASGSQTLGFGDTTVLLRVGGISVGEFDCVSVGDESVRLPSAARTSEYTRWTGLISWIDQNNGPSME